MKHRRSFLALLTSLVLMPFQSALAKPVLPPLGARDNALLSLLRDVVADNPAVERLGKSHLHALIGRNATGQMMQRLFGGLPRNSTMNAEQLRRHLATLRQADFAADNLVTVDGWVLAESEADAITLVMLSHDIAQTG